jgi:hypothetical protein
MLISLDSPFNIEIFQGVYNVQYIRSSYIHQEPANFRKIELAMFCFVLA